MNQIREENISGNLLRELKEIDNFEQEKSYEEETYSFTAGCTTIYTIICC